MLERARIGLAFIGLLIFALVLIIAGVQGSPGRLLAVILCPGRLEVEDSQAGNSTSATASSTSAGGTVTL